MAAAKRVLVPVLLLSGMASVAWGTWCYFSPAAAASQVDSTAIVLDPAPPFSENIIYIDVSGAVEQPGIYPVSEGDRVAAALEAAGGVTEQADLRYLHSSLNLSLRLHDEDKVYVPFAGEVAAETQSSTEFAIDPTDGLISINTATLNELDELPRVGAVTAQKIIDGRPFSAIDELLTKKVLGAAAFAEIESLVKL